MTQTTDNRRLFLALGLIAVLMFVWQQWFMPKPKVKPGADGGAVAALSDGGAAPVVAAAVPDAGAPAVAAAIAPAPVATTPTGGPRPPEELATFDSPTRTLVFTSWGGTLKSAVLKGEQFKVKDAKGKDVPVDLVEVKPGMPLPFSMSLGGGLPAAPRDLPYAMEKTADGVVFTAKVGELTIVKRYTVPSQGYDVALAVELHNAGPAASGTLSMVADTYVVPGSEQGGAWYERGPVNHRSAIVRFDKSTERHIEDKDGKAATYSGDLHFAGIDEQYFLAAYYPVEASPASITMVGTKDGERSVETSFNESLPADGTLARTYGLYLGPKLKEALEKAGSTLPALKNAKPQLDQSVEYGMFEVIALILLVVMRWFHVVIPNWGLDILLLTLAVKVATLPLTMKQMAQAEKTRVLQPKMEEIKRKYKDDKERQNAETMKLYQQAGVNPLSGCLPLIIQMPVFFGLYRLLEYAFDIYRQPFIHGWINDLSAKDPTYVLPILLIVSMFVSQTMMPTMGDPAQQKMMKYVMPVMFGVFMIGLPAGLSLYYAFNNMLNIIQQLYLRKRYPAARPPTNGKNTKLATA